MALFFKRKNNGRSDRIRTYDPLVPNQMRYQTALRSDFFLRVGVSLKRVCCLKGSYEKCKPYFTFFFKKNAFFCNFMEIVENHFRFFLNYLMFWIGRCCYFFKLRKKIKKVFKFEFFILAVGDYRIAYA